MKYGNNKYEDIKIAYIGGRLTRLGVGIYERPCGV